MASVAAAESDYDGNHQHRSGSYEQKAAAPVKVAKATNADGKRLPGRDCKFYEGGTRQHGFPQYEVGNPNRPECPAETE